MKKVSNANNNSCAVKDILDALSDAASDHDDVALGTIRDAIRHRGYGPFLIVPAVLEVTPIGAVPGVPSLRALIISRLALQIALGRKDMWLPSFVENLSISADKLQKSVKKLRSFGERVDHWFHGRLPILTINLAIRVAAVAALALCLTVPPLELVPFASSLPMSAIAFLGLEILMRDGLLMLAGYAAALIAVAAGYGFIGL